MRDQRRREALVASAWSREDGRRGHPSKTGVTGTPRHRVRATFRERAPPQGEPKHELRFDPPWIVTLRLGGRVDGTADGRGDMTKLDVWVAYANIERFRGLIAETDCASRVATIQALLEAEERKLSMKESGEGQWSKARRPPAGTV
jgi:hypothetical protein